MVRAEFWTEKLLETKKNLTFCQKWVLDGSGAISRKNWNFDVIAKNSKMLAEGQIFEKAS